MTTADSLNKTTPSILGFVPLQLERLREILPPTLALLFLAAVYWGTFSRSHVANVDEDPTLFIQAAIRGQGVHANGYPTYILFLRILHSIVPEGRFVAIANFSSAFFGLLALALAYTLFRLLDVGRAIASCSILFIGLRPIFWSKCLFVEVYQLSNALLSASLLALVWAMKSPRLLPLLLTGFLCGLQATHHLLGIPAAGLIWLAGLWETVRRSASGRVRRVGLYSVCTCIGLLPYLYLPSIWSKEGISIREGFIRVFGSLTKEQDLHPESVSLLERWSPAGHLLLSDLGLIGLTAALAGFYALLVNRRSRGETCFAFILAVGGFLVPVVYLMRVKHWECLECLAWHLGPIFSLCLFIPFAFQGCAIQLASLMGTGVRDRRIGTGSMCLALLFLSWMALADSYPKLKQTKGDSRYAAISRALNRVEPDSTVLCYRTFGRYEYWDVLRQLEGIGRGEISWKNYPEKTHRSSLNDRPALDAVKNEIGQLKGPYYILTDSPEPITHSLQERGKRFEIVFAERFHELPRIRVSRKGTVSLRPRNWLEFLTGWVVWELDQGFTSGHVFHNLAIRWSFRRQKTLLGELVCGLDYSSQRFSRQRLYSIQAAFDGGEGFSLRKYKRLWMEMDPLSRARPMQSWYYKERIPIPFSIEPGKEKNPAGNYELNLVACFPPHDESSKVTPIAQVFIKVTE